MVTPMRWLATTEPNRAGSPDYERVAVGAKDVLAMLGDAERIRVQRTTGNSSDREPLRIYVETPAVLLDDVEHGDAIYALTKLQARYGRQAGIRLEVQW